MARAHRVALVTFVLAFIYTLAWFNFVSVPLVDVKTVDAVLPVVRRVSLRVINANKML